MSRFWSKKVHSLKPYVPGEQPQLENLIKLNTNENPYAPSPKVLEAISKATNESLRKYPDPNGLGLKQTIADYYDLDLNQVFIGNSSDEVLGHAFQALLKQDQPLLFPDISYSFYPVYCRLFGINYQQIPLRADFSIGIDDYQSEGGAVIFANPNAPTGLALDLHKIAELLEQNTDRLVVIDEAYADFSEHSAVGLVQRHANLLVVQTLSKSRALAGLRVGFALGQADLISGLERVKNSFHPYALDSLALAGAVAAFDDDAYFKKHCSMIIDTRDRFSQELKQLGFEVLPSAANFVFAKHKSKPAKDLFEDLRKEAIIVRYFDKPRLDNYLRISIGTDKEMQTLLNKLGLILNQDNFST